MKKLNENWAVFLALLLILCYSYIKFRYSFIGFNPFPYMEFSEVISFAFNPFFNFKFTLIIILLSTWIFAMFFPEKLDRDKDYVNFQAFFIVFFIVCYSSIKILIEFFGNRYLQVTNKNISLQYETISIIISTVIYFLLIIKTNIWTKFKFNIVLGVSFVVLFFVIFFKIDFKEFSNNNIKSLISNSQTIEIKGELIVAGDFKNYIVLRNNSSKEIIICNKSDIQKIILKGD
ncbi:MAG TPA: hypothetical protein VK175_07235 [Leadbetterella sp.]|nr:hypothetical protein [Leadbetterella sp.]